jgi:hypothetical protein
LSFHHHLLHQQPKVSSNNPMASPITQHVPTLEATIFTLQHHPTTLMLTSMGQLIAASLLLTSADYC